MNLNNKVYDILKWVALIVLPAIGTLYFALSNIWGLPYGEEVVGTVGAVDTFLGALLGISTYKYKGDGVFEIYDSDENKDVYRLNLETPIEELPNKGSITFKVNSNKQSD